MDGVGDRVRMGRRGGDERSGEMWKREDASVFGKHLCRITAEVKVPPTSCFPTNEV